MVQKDIIMEPETDLGLRDDDPIFELAICAELLPKII